MYFTPKHNQILSYVSFEEHHASTRLFAMGEPITVVDFQYNTLDVY